MKNFLIIALILIQTIAFGQNAQKWRLGIKTSIENLSISRNNYGQKYIRTDESINGYSVKFDQKNYSIGLRAKYSLKEKLDLSSGISYSNKDFSGRYNCATCDFIGIFPETTIEQRFLTIPLSIEYLFLKGKFKPALEGGFENNFKLKNNIKKISNNYFLEAYLGVSINYALMEKWILNVGYNYQKSISHLYKTDESELRTNSFFLRISYLLKSP